MSRFIDADALKKSLEAWAVNLGNPKMLVKEETEIIIDSAPSIDIVRCGECKHCVPYSTCDGDYQMCMRWEDYSCDVNLNDFCSYGERNCSEKPNKSERSSE